MKNYTTVINGVLNEWLVEKGWDVHRVDVWYTDPGYMSEDRGYPVTVFGSGIDFWVQFTQSELDDAKCGMCSKSHYMKCFIRAKLEKEVGK